MLRIQSNSLWRTTKDAIQTFPATIHLGFTMSSVEQRDSFVLHKDSTYHFFKLYIHGICNDHQVSLEDLDLLTVKKINNPPNSFMCNILCKFTGTYANVAEVAAKLQSKIYPNNTIRNSR